MSLFNQFSTTVYVCVYMRNMRNVHALEYQLDARIRD